MEETEPRSLHPTRSAWGIDAVQALLLLPFFFTIELARAVLWMARTVDEPDRDGPLLCVLFARLVSALLAVVPCPVWALVAHAARAAWVPVRGVLWLWGIGRRRDAMKRSPRAVSRWYGAQREKTLQRQLGRQQQQQQ